MTKNDDYIKRSEAVTRLTGKAASVSNTRIWAKAINIVEMVPAADVAPVRHGRWLDYDDTERFTARCSLCNNVIDTRFGTHFCPKCGADMKEEEAQNDEA